MNTRIRINLDQAELCALFMLDMDSAELAAPLSVLNALEEWNTARDEWTKNQALSRLASAIERWAIIDRAACVATLGPGLGVEE